MRVHGVFVLNKTCSCFRTEKWSSKPWRHTWWSLLWWVLVAAICSEEQVEYSELKRCYGRIPFFYVSLLKKFTLGLSQRETVGSLGHFPSWFNDGRVFSKRLSMWNYWFSGGVWSPGSSGHIWLCGRHQAGQTGCALSKSEVTRIWRFLIKTILLTFSIVCCENLFNKVVIHLEMFKTLKLSSSTFRRSCLLWVTSLIISTARRFYCMCWAPETLLTSCQRSSRCLKKEMETPPGVCRQDIQH